MPFCRMPSLPPESRRFPKYPGFYKTGTMDRLRKCATTYAIQLVASSARHPSMRAKLAEELRSYLDKTSSPEAPNVRISRDLLMAEMNLMRREPIFELLVRCEQAIVEATG